ncbi:MAG: CinA family nicotinamide mononucleotide deamidase-related protein, partial [Planctomycetota bacterium]
MRAEIIAVGDEIASGQLLDTNTQWLSRRLEALGVRVLFHTVVGDELEPMAGVFRQAVERADVVVATGGLGPTADDLTREAIAEATGRALLLDPRILDEIRQMFTRRGRRMPGQNERQATFPEGSRAIPNPHGTAPGIALEVPREGSGPCRVFALPGVPAEMKEMWQETVVPALRKAGAGRRIVRHRVIKCFGAGESDVEARLPDLIRRGRTPRVGINASKTTILLRIAAEGASEEECDAQIEPVVSTIRRCLGTLVFGEGDDELQHVVARLLAGQGKTLATVEWGSGGMIADWMHQADATERCYAGGVVVTAETALEKVLSVPAHLVARHSPISGEVARAMAVECRRRFDADLGLAVSPCPEYDRLAPKPEPMFVALAAADDVLVKSFPYAG